MSAKLINSIGQNYVFASSRAELFDKQELDALKDLELAQTQELENARCSNLITDIAQGYVSL